MVHSGPVWLERPLGRKETGLDFEAQITWGWGWEK